FSSRRRHTRSKRDWSSDVCSSDLWVISRQRAWGVPLPIFYAEDGEAIITPETINHVADLFAEHGSNVWFEKEAKDLLPEGFTHRSEERRVGKRCRERWYRSH